MDNARILTLSDAARTLPGRVHLSTIWRWARRSVKARNGERIRLEHQRLGARIFIAPSALDDFGRKLAEADAEHFDSGSAIAVASKNRTATRRERDIQAAEADLARRGIR